MKKLILFGDSIMKGVTFNGSGYHLCPDHDLPQLAARGIEIENHTKMGATIGDGLRAMDKYLTGCDSQTTVLLGYGGNDCDYDWQAISDAPSADHSPKTAPDAYIEGMRRAIRKAQDAGAMVAVASLVPLDADRYLQFISKNRDGPLAAALSTCGRPSCRSAISSTCSAPTASTQPTAAMPSRIKPSPPPCIDNARAELVGADNSVRPQSIAHL